MITFEGKQEILKPAEMLERSARNIYPHISTSRIKTHLDLLSPRPNFYLKMTHNLKLIRQTIKETGDFYSGAIYGFKEHHLGNCAEEAIFAELLGKINGQHNIYTGCVFINNEQGKIKKLDHAIAFITDKEIKNGYKYDFRNKDAIIIDPWLNVTDFAGSYFAKLKTTFSTMFSALPKNKFVTSVAKYESHNPEEYKKFIKKVCPKIDFIIVPFMNKVLKEEYVNNLKELYPEFIIKNFKKVDLTV